jgi:glycosyltransferase involved in cell wall biosynthesis
MKIVWFSEIKWDYLRTRKQQIISRKPADVQLLYLEPYVKGRRNMFGLRKEGDIFCATVPFLKSVPGFMWRRVLESRTARKMVEEIVHLRAAKLLKMVKFDEASTGFVISNIYAIDTAMRLERRFLIYDCNDAHDAFPGMPQWTHDYFLRTCTKADAVFASSRTLMERALTLRNGRDCLHLGNGVEYDRFALNEAALKERASAKKVRLGYLGAIAPWLNFDILIRLAESHPDWEIVLTGPLLLGVEREVERLTALPNAHRLEPVSYERVPDMLRQFTVGLIPFRYNNLTKSVNPNKLYEYLASGLPVIATRFSPEVEGYPEVVRVTDSEGDFIKACEETVASIADRSSAVSMALEAQRMVRRNDWNILAGIFWNNVNNRCTPAYLFTRR